ncbi:MAG: hypothetical protein N4A65_03675 [Cohaesibacter sp.]|jgi:hypothetical protein|nr:hypothetical protein [Cohaesibacter sp.]
MLINVPLEKGAAEQRADYKQAYQGLLSLTSGKGEGKLKTNEWSDWDESKERQS